MNHPRPFGWTFCTFGLSLGHRRTLIRVVTTAWLFGCCDGRVMSHCRNRLSCSMYGKSSVIQVGPQHPGLETAEHGPRPFHALTGSHPGWGGVVGRAAAGNCLLALS